jgi:hypothetical protein
MFGAIDLARAERLAGAPVQELLEQFLLEKLETFAGLADGSEIRGQFLCAVTGKDLRKFSVARLECGQRGQSGTAKVLKGIVSHEWISSNCRDVQSGRAGLQWRYIKKNDSLGVARVIGLDA